MKPNDKTAPRARAPIKKTLDKDFFQYLFDKVPVLRYKYTPLQIKKIILEFNQMLADEIIENRYGVELPIINNQIYLKAYKPLAPKKTGHKFQRIEYYDNKDEIRNNDKTGGYKLKIMFVKIPHKMQVKNSGFYAFFPHRTLRVNSSKSFVNNYNKYCKQLLPALNATLEPKVQDLSNYNELEV